MGKKLKKKAPKKKKTSQKNYDSGRIDWGLGIRSSSDSESFQNEDELSGMNLLSFDVLAIYPFGKDESDSEATEFAFMGEQEKCQIEAVFRRLADKVKDQQDLLNKIGRASCRERV